MAVTWRGVIVCPRRSTATISPGAASASDRAMASRDVSTGRASNALPPPLPAVLVVPHRRPGYRGAFPFRAGPRSVTYLCASSACRWFSTPHGSRRAEIREPCHVYEVGGGIARFQGPGGAAMGRSDMLRVGEVRDAYRLIGECRDLGNDPARWFPRMLEGLSRLVGGIVTG